MIKRAISFYKSSPKKNIKIFIYCATLSLLESIERAQKSLIRGIHSFGKFQSSLIFSLIYCIAAIPTLVLYLLLEYWKTGKNNSDFQPEPVANLVSSQDKMF